MAKNKHIGQSLEDFLREDGILEEVDARVQKRIVADELQAAMKKQKISVVTMARRMKTSRTQVRRLLDPNDDSATIISLARAAQAVGYRFRISFKPEPKTVKARATAGRAR